MKILLKPPKSQILTRTCIVKIEAKEYKIKKSLPFSTFYCEKIYEDHNI